jgi:hypothetical protein
MIQSSYSMVATIVSITTATPNSLCAMLITCYLTKDLKCISKHPNLRIIITTLKQKLFTAYKIKHKGFHPTRQTQAL